MLVSTILYVNSNGKTDEICSRARKIQRQRKKLETCRGHLRVISMRVKSARNHGTEDGFRLIPNVLTQLTFNRNVDFSRFAIILN